MRLRFLWISLCLLMVISSIHAAGREKYNFNSGWKLKVGDIAQAALRLFFQIQILIFVE